MKLDPASKCVGRVRLPAQPPLAAASFRSSRSRIGRPEPWQPPPLCRSEEHTSELQSLMRISYAVFCLKKKNPDALSQTRNTQQEQTKHQTNIPITSSHY